MDNHAPVLVTLADGRVSVLGNIEGMNHDPFGHYSFFDWIKDYNRSTIEQLSANVVDIPLARYNPTVEALKPFTDWADRESEKINNLVPTLTPAVPDFRELIPQAELFNSFKKLNELVSTSFELPQEVYKNLTQTFHLTPPTNWIDAAALVWETEGVEEAVQEFADSNSDELIEIRRSFLEIAEKTPYPVPAHRIQWTYGLIASGAMEVISTTVGVPVGVAILIALMVYTVYTPLRSFDQ